MPRSPRTLLSALILAVALAGCQSVQMEKGNILEPEVVALIKPGKTTQREVAAYLGSPTMVNTFRANRWIYIHDRRFEGNRAVNRVEITFDRAGVVSHVDKNFGDDLMSPTKTPDGSALPPKTVWQKLIGDSPTQELGVKEGLAKVGPVPAPALDPKVEQERARLNWFDRYVLFKKPEETAKAAPATAKPTTTFTSQEEGWWRKMWQEDPTKPLKRFDATNKDPLESKKWDINGNYPAHQAEAAPEQPAAGDNKKPWWKFWSND